MLLAFDVGNSNIVIGVFKGRELIKDWRMSTDKSKTSDEIGILVNQFFEYEGMHLTEIKAVIISSVVPTIMYSLEHMIRKYCKIEPIVVGPGIRTGMNVKYDNPRQVGADRIVNGVAVHKKYGGHCIVVDFGTATTFCAISESCEYLGGVISPGIKIMSDALFERAAKLTRVELQKPPSVICRNTTQAIQSGVIFGNVGMVDYIIERMKNELNWPEAKIIATGGLSNLIATESRLIQHVDRDLTLEGLRYVYEMNLDRKVTLE